MKNQRRTIAWILAAMCVSGSAVAETKPDLTTVKGVMIELYASLDRPPGKQFAWDRFRALMLPGAIIVPQPLMMKGETRIMTVDDFIAWIDSSWAARIGTPGDPGIFEEQTNVVVEQYGDVALAFSTYEKSFYEPSKFVGRGINAVQLVRRNDRWYVLSITWDEETTAGPVSARYRGAS